MSVLVDTGVLGGFLNRRDREHEAALRFVRDVMGGVHGRAMTTTFVLDEVLTLLRARKQPYLAAEHALALVGLLPDSDLPHLVSLVETDVSDIRSTITLQERYWERGLSFTDCTLLHVMERDNIDKLATFDGRFRGLVALV